MEHEWSRNAVAVSRRGTVFECDVCRYCSKECCDDVDGDDARQKQAQLKSQVSSKQGWGACEVGIGTWWKEAGSGLGLGGRRNHGRRDEARSALLCSAVGVIGSLLGMSSEEVAAGRAGNSGRACDFVWGEGTF
jgi:hypothetical protein